MVTAGFRVGNLRGQGGFTQIGTYVADPVEPRTWELPPEPGPEVRRLRPVERYRGDTGIWLDREPDDSGWRLVVMGRPADEALEWIRAYGLGAATCWGGRPLIDATSEAVSDVH